MTEYMRKEKYNPEMTASESDERSNSWNEFFTELERYIVESEEFKMTITTDTFECEECGDDSEAKITVTKREDDEHALHVRAKCLDCEGVYDYYAYIDR